MTWRCGCCDSPPVSCWYSFLAISAVCLHSAQDKSLLHFRSNDVCITNILLATALHNTIVQCDATTYIIKWYLFHAQIHIALMVPLFAVRDILQYSFNGRVISLQLQIHSQKFWPPPINKLYLIVWDHVLNI